MPIKSELRRFLFGALLALLLAAGPGLPVATLVRAAEPFSCADVSEIPQSECEALVALYNSTNGPGWSSNTGWLTTTTLCSWEGVTCHDGHVSELDLVDHWLFGSIPHQLGKLVRLQVLRLGYNRLSGPIPLELGDLADVTQLNIAGNELTGSIPLELGDLVNLQVLDLGHNQLGGTDPT